MMYERNPEAIVADIRRQRGIRNMIWPAVMLKDLMILCDAYDRQASAIDARNSLLRRVLEYVDTCPDLYRPGGDELANEIKAQLSSNARNQPPADREAG